MEYNWDRVIQILEYNKIIDLLKEETASNCGKKIADNLMPQDKEEIIKKQLDETQKAVDIIISVGDPPLGGLSDIGHLLRKISLGYILQVDELITAVNFLHCSGKVKSFFSDISDKIGCLGGISENISAFPFLKDKIDKTINNRGEIDDHASHELYAIRQKIRSEQSKVQERLQSIIHSSQYEKYLQENIITTREGRYVVPVKAEYRGSFPGIVHDRSASGATFYIEPISVMEANNKVKQLQLDENKEIERILAWLTGLIIKEIEAIRLNLDSLSMLDFIFAKARLALKMNAFYPLVNTNGYVNIRKGRHPLLKEDAVPIDICVGKDFKTLLITGPNTGGKTVTLKTIGLFCLMVQSGLFIPADSGSEIGIFKRIFSDIGDEQSIEQSLSTFSSHMGNIISIIKNANADSLILLDELGAGTDPTEGAALAMAIVEHFLTIGAITVATTHYSELKIFAYHHNDVENACMEFDIESLRPTYRIFMGIPGKSNAFEISRKLGLQEGIIKQASQYLTQDNVRVEEMIDKMEKTQFRLQQDQARLHDMLKNAEMAQLLAEQSRQKLGREESMIKEKARDEARAIVEDAERESQILLDRLRNELKNADEKRLVDLRSEVRQQLRNNRQKLDRKKEKLDERMDMERPVSIVAGQDVYIVSLDQNGTILKYSGQDEAVIQVGLMRVTVPISDIAVQTNKTKKEAKKIFKELGENKAKTISIELDLRGLLTEEAVEKAEKYLDDAYLAVLPKVYLIHGKGTGALRQSIRDMLQSNPHVASYQAAGYNEGGDGVTIVRLRLQ